MLLGLVEEDEDRKGLFGELGEQGPVLTDEGYVVEECFEVVGGFVFVG